VLIVGDNGTALHWDGNTWMTTQPSSGAVDLHAAGAKLGGTSILAVGAGGSIARYTGGNWQAGTSRAHTAPRALSVHAAQDSFLVGDGPNILFVLNAGNAASVGKVLSAVPMYAVAVNPNGGMDSYYVAGAISGGKGFAESWDGNNKIQPQMTPPGASIAGN